MIISTDVEKAFDKLQQSFIIKTLGKLEIEGNFLNLIKTTYQKPTVRASLVAQWLRICLLMQGTRVRALVWEDPTCRRATRPVSHNY